MYFGSTNAVVENILVMGLNTAVIYPVLSQWDPYSLDPAGLGVAINISGTTCEHLTAGQFTLQVDYVAAAG